MTYIQKIFSAITRCNQLLGKAIAFILQIMIILVRPHLGPMNICPYSIGCTQYALLELQEQRLPIALKNIWDRLIQCHPLGNRHE